MVFYLEMKNSVLQPVFRCVCIYFSVFSCTLNCRNMVEVIFMVFLLVLALLNLFLSLFFFTLRVCHVAGILKSIEGIKLINQKIRN